MQEKKVNDRAKHPQTERLPTPAENQHEEQQQKETAKDQQGE